MITQLNSSTLSVVYPKKTNEYKEIQPNAKLSKDNTNRVEQLKSSIHAGEYKVDLQALSEKVADFLL